MINNKSIEKIPEIYFLTLIDNIESIFIHGILSKNKILREKIKFKDCSNATIQTARSMRKIGDLYLHDYANLYFGKRPPMHHNMVYTQGIKQATICYLCVKSDVLLTSGMYFTDGHIIYPQTKVYNDLRYLDNLSWNILNDPFFLAKKSDGSYKYESEGNILRRKQAEVLIPYFITPKYFKRIIVFNQKTKDYIKNKIGDIITIDIDKSFYF